jgi:hypothetical protein
MSSPSNNEDAGTITRDVAARLIMVEPGAFDQLVREGWFKPVSRLRYKLVDVVQGHIKAMQHEVERGRTASEAAAHIDLGVGRFGELVETNIIPRQKTRSYRLDDVRQVYIRHLRSVAAGHGADNGAALSTQRARLADAQTRAAELKTGIMAGDFVRLASVRKVLEREFGTMREKILTTPGKWADALTPFSPKDRSAIYDILYAEACELLTCLSTSAVLEASADRARKLGMRWDDRDEERPQP